VLDLDFKALFANLCKEGKAISIAIVSRGRNNFFEHEDEHEDD
jgi:hypothetical protein